MLEYFTYKKVKKHRDEKEKRDSKSNTPIASPSTPTSSRPRPPTKLRTSSSSSALEGPASPILNDEDEYFLHRFISAEGTPPPLPERRPTLPARPSDASGTVLMSRLEQLGWQTEVGNPVGNEGQLVLHDSGRDKENVKGKGKGKQKKEESVGEAGDIDEKTGKAARKWKALSFLHKKRENQPTPDLQPDPSITPSEAQREKDDLTNILEDLNLSAHNNRAFSLSQDSTVLVQKFTLILKDLINGVPTAYDDLVHLLDDSQPTLAKSYDSLPSFLQKLITQLPSKFTSSLAPELLAVATEAQAFPIANAASAAQKGGMGAAAKSFLTPSSLKDLVTKPGAVVGMLKAIVNALKLRWPAFMGTNVLLSLALFVLLFVFWYCYKRGKEVRLGRDGRLTPGESSGGEGRSGGGSRESSRLREGGEVANVDADADGYKARRDKRQREKELKKDEVRTEKSRKSRK